MPFLDLSAFSAGKTMIVLCAVIAIACIDIVRRLKHRPTHLFFATVFGTALSIGLIQTSDLFLHSGSEGNPYAMAGALLFAILGWKALFGPWEVQTKLTMLSTFLFWICLHLFWDDTSQQQYIRLIAAGVAIIPAIIWCKLFLKYHRERWSAVILLFLAGALSTVPILLYDAMVRRGVEMQFFFFRLTPESFNQSAQNFVAQQVTNGNHSHSVLFATLLSFLFVGFIEEVSKYWVINRSAKQLCTSIDDMMQLSIMVAIGFSFAENIVNPVYFTAFVNDYLMHGASSDIAGFASNVLGRSVLTSMVHIVSTGVMGYFLGLAMFASPVLAEQHSKGRMHGWFNALHRLLRIKETSIFRVQMLTMGLLTAILLHGVFNFIVTLPELLPGNPRSLYEAFGESARGFDFLDRIPLLLIPALFYVVGGFWLLTTLFLRKENMLERGHVITEEELVKIVPEEE